MSGQSKRAEEQLRVLHSQNISPSSSINLTYRNNGTRVCVQQSEIERQEPVNSFRPHRSPLHHTIHGGYIYNMGDIQENGGLVDDREVTDTVVDLPQNLKMNLKDARNVFKGNTLYYTQNLRHSARESRFLVGRDYSGRAPPYS